MLDDTPLATGDEEAIYDWVSSQLSSAVEVDLELLHELLHDGRHCQHQAVVRALQMRRDGRSVEHLAAALDGGVERFAYTCSEAGVIAKWFSHALFDIGTPEAFRVLHMYAASAEPEIAEEMQYRLAKRRI
jgi:hypothetical protein